MSKGIGLRLKNCRKDARWTQYKVAKEFGVSVSAVRKHEKGVSVTLDLLYKAAELYKVRIEHFFAKADPDPNKVNIEAGEKAPVDLMSKQERFKQAMLDELENIEDFKLQKTLLKTAVIFSHSAITPRARKRLEELESEFGEL